MRENAWGGHSILTGAKPAADAVRLDGNDYLRLTGHPKIINAQIASLTAQRDHVAGQDAFVVQSAAFLTAEYPSRALALKLVAYVGKDNGHVTSSGYMANLGLLQAICAPDSPVYLDALAHLSLWEGARSAKANAMAVRHNDPVHLERQIARNGAGVVVVDSVYSLNGAVCPLVEMVEVCEAHGCTLVVDESHSLGLYGPRGAGLVAELGLSDRVAFITASLAKAFAARAGFISVPSCLEFYVFARAYPQIFSSALLPHEIAGLDATLDVILESDTRRAALHATARRVRKTLSDQGFPVATGTEQIIAFEAGTERQVMDLRDRFIERGVVAAVFATPAAPASRPFLRMTLHSELTEAELLRIEHAGAVIAEELKPQDWAAARRQARPARG